MNKNKYIQAVESSQLRDDIPDFSPGDTIVVPRDLNQLEGLPLVSVATKIISDIAFSAASLNVLKN